MKFQRMMHGGGKGFTEWTNVQAARPLFKGHIQPKHPLNGNNYNLLEKDTVKWQTSLLHKYHIDGMVYYHYYFNGKLLLEKPAENLLKLKDIEMPVTGTVKKMLQCHKNITQISGDRHC